MGIQQERTDVEDKCQLQVQWNETKEIFLRTGMTSKDIGNGGGINPFLNRSPLCCLSKITLNFMNQTILLWDTGVKL